MSRFTRLQVVAASRWRGLRRLVAVVVVLGAVGVPSSPASAAVVQRQDIIGVGVLCLDVPYANYTNGTDLWMWGCNSTSAQSWYYDPSTGNIRVLGTHKCLDVEGPYVGNGIAVQIWDCKNVPQHRWSVTVLGQIKSHDGRCLDVRGGSTAPKTRVQVWACTNPPVPAQKWQPNPADRLVTKCGAYFSTMYMDYHSFEGNRVLVYRLVPTVAAQWALLNPFNRDNMWSEFKQCAGPNWGHRLPSDAAGINTEFLENQLYCHALASATGNAAIRREIGPSWDLENEDINLVDYCGDIPIPG